MEWEEIGRVNHYYSKIAVAILELSAELKVGELIKIVGPKTETEQVVKSMQVDHRNIDVAKPGDLVGLKVEEKVRQGDIVYKQA
ncbi:MAG TPA: translation elongation factor-like protein [Bacillota bacterium]|nr:translation elongation factor-like protein [Bacillota bacterium]